MGWFFSRKKSNAPKAPVQDPFMEYLDEAVASGQFIQYRQGVVNKIQENADGNALYKHFSAENLLRYYKHVGDNPAYEEDYVYDKIINFEKYRHTADILLRMVTQCRDCKGIRCNNCQGKDTQLTLKKMSLRISILLNWTKAKTLSLNRLKIRCSHPFKFSTKYER